MRIIKKIAHCMAIALLILQPFTTFAQPNDDELNDPDDQAPIDGGISLLIAAGVGYGAKKMYDLKTKKGK